MQHYVSPSISRKGVDAVILRRDTYTDDEYRLITRAPILKGIVALNPMMYCNEFLRFAMSPTIRHIAPLWSCSIAIGWGILFTILGIATLRLRIQLG